LAPRAARRKIFSSIGDKELLYDEVFRKFGVDKVQYATLLAHGTKCRVGAGQVIVRGGMKNSKLMLLLQGEAKAHKWSSDVEAGNWGTPVCKYVGKLLGVEGVQEKDEESDDPIVPIRGSVIGGSALVDPSVTSGNYPTDVVAVTPVEWLEWDLKTLLQLIDAPKFRAVQASFYHMLYFELLSTLDRNRVAQMQRGEQDDAVQGAARPTPRQLFSLTVFVAVPFFGFGFADNFIMIVCGDAIDARFGATLGLTTLAAAGLGNWISDVVGLGLGDVIERTASKMGLSNGRLSPAQERMNVAKLTSLFAKLLGISLGCFAGMIPLLILTPTKTEFTKEDLEIYDSIFRPNGVSTAQFEMLMEQGVKQKAAVGSLLVAGGAEKDKLILVLHGEAIAYKHVPEVEEQPRDKPVFWYVGNFNTADESSRKTHGKLPCRGSIIGGTSLVHHESRKNPRPCDVVVTKPMSYIEWSFKDLWRFMDEEQSIRTSFHSMLYVELLQNIRSSSLKQKEQYRSLMEVVLVDGVVHDQERDVLMKFKQKLHISDEEHEEILGELGWSAEAWRRGTHYPGLRPSYPLSDSNRGDDSVDQLAQLRHAEQIIEHVIESMLVAGTVSNPKAT